MASRLFRYGRVSPDETRSIRGWVFSDWTILTFPPAFPFPRTATTNRCKGEMCDQFCRGGEGGCVEESVCVWELRLSGADVKTLTQGSACTHARFVHLHTIACVCSCAACRAGQQGSRR